MRGRTTNANSAFDRRWWILGVLCLSLLVIAIDKLDEHGLDD